MREPETSFEATDQPAREMLTNSRGEVVHLVVRSVEAAWLPFDEEEAVALADEGIDRLISTREYA